LTIYCNTQDYESYLNIPFAQIEGVDPILLSLDIYKTPEAYNQKVMIYSHGGGYEGGDKDYVGYKDGLLSKGYILVSANYRLSPDVKFPSHAKDVAASISWVYENIFEYGGDPDQIYLVGGSAGAHLVTLVATDERYLKEKGLNLNVIKGVISLDVSLYDFPLYAALFGGFIGSLETYFTNNPDFWKFASPSYYVTPGKNIPPMIIAYTEEDSSILSKHFVDKLNYEGIRSSLLPVTDKNHHQIDWEFGKEDYETQNSLNFIESGSSYTRLTFEQDFIPETLDESNKFMVGTEITHLETHNGQLFAAVSYLNSNHSNDLNLGQCVLIKESKKSDWKIDSILGSPGKGSITSLKSISFTTDKEGLPLEKPESILLASPNDGTSDLRIFSRDNNSLVWTEMILLSDVANSNKAFASLITDHIDSVTGIHYVFVGSASSGLYRGAFDPSVTGNIKWDPEPELSCPESIDSASEANRVLYVTVTSNGNPEDKFGGLFKRIDGTEPFWKFIYEWENKSKENTGMFGLTTVKNITSIDSEILICTLEGSGKIEKINPMNNHEVTLEFDYKSYFENIWEVPIDKLKYTSFKNVCNVINYTNNRKYFLFGVGISHPEHDKKFYNGSYYLVRDEDGKYDWGYIYDNENIKENTWSQNCRAIAVSPFAEDRSRVLYFGGYDTEDSQCQNTAWIFKGEFAKNTCDPTLFATVNLYYLHKISDNKEALEISVNVENFSSNEVDLYAGIAIKDVIYWFPNWYNYPERTIIPNYKIWKEILLDVTLTPDLKKSLNNLIFYSAITKHRTFDPIDIDQINIKVK